MNQNSKVARQLNNEPKLAINLCEVEGGIRFMNERPFSLCDTVFSLSLDALF